MSAKQQLIKDIEENPMYISSKDKEDAIKERRKANLMELVRKQEYRDYMRKRNREIENDR